MDGGAPQAGLGHSGWYPFHPGEREKWDGPDVVGGGRYGEGRGEEDHEAKGSSSSSGAQTFAFHTVKKDCSISVGGLHDIGFVSVLCFPVYCLVYLNKV